MELRTVLVVIHVVTAVLGAGQIVGLALLAKAELPSGGSVAALMRLARVVSWSLLIMLLSGIALLYTSQWTMAQTGWLRLAFALYVVLGALMGIAQGRLRKALATPALAPQAVNTVAKLAWSGTLLLAAIVVLMVAKPF